MESEQERRKKIREDMDGTEFIGRDRSRGVHQILVGRRFERQLKTVRLACAGIVENGRKHGII